MEVTTVLMYQHLRLNFKKRSDWESNGVKVCVLSASIPLARENKRSISVEPKMCCKFMDVFFGCSLQRLRILIISGIDRNSSSKIFVSVSFDCALVFRCLQASHSWALILSNYRRCILTKTDLNAVLGEWTEFSLMYLSLIERVPSDNRSAQL